ncbi:hypothetical protein ACS0TY_005718 [Phlomoides rotata]
MCHTEVTLRSIAARIGVLEVFEPPGGLNVGSYLRFKVTIDVTKPFIRGLKVRVRGEEKWIPIKYESLLFYCYCCGMVGHNFKSCDLYDHNDCPGPVDMKFGPFLKASPLKKGRGVKVENVSVGTNLQKGEEVSVLHSIPEKPMGLSLKPNLNTGLLLASSPNTIPPSSSDAPSPTSLPSQTPTIHTISKKSHDQSIIQSAPPKKTHYVTHTTTTDKSLAHSIEPYSIQNLATTPPLVSAVQDEVLGPDGPNPNRKSWKRSARAKGKRVSSFEVGVQTGSGTKRGAESCGDLMDIDCFSSSPKRGKRSMGVDGEEFVESDDLFLSAVDVSGLHYRDQ